MLQPWVPRPFIGSLTIHGAAGALLWGYHTAVELSSWRIAKNDTGQWCLSGTVKRLDAFQARQTPLLFTAPHEHARDGFWAWGVESIEVGAESIRAILGPPEQ